MEIKMTYCNHSNQKKYPFVLPELPYGKDDFKPHFTAETFEYHYNKHHNSYVINLNKLIEGTDLATKSLEEISNMETTKIDIKGIVKKSKIVKPKKLLIIEEDEN